MVGKAALIVIMGFSLIFGLASQYWNRTSNRAVENLYSYYDSTAAHVLAISAANILADSIFWVQSNPAALKSLNLGERTYEPGAEYTMTTALRIVDGDSCILATACGRYEGVTGNIINDTVEILLRPGRFCTWAFFTGDDNGVYWKTNDTLNGDYHTNTRLFIDGHPVFQGNVTTGTGLAAYNNGHPINPILPTKLPDAAGDKLDATAYESGDIIPLPSTLAVYNSIPQSTIFSSSDTHSNYAYDVYFTFNSSDPTKVGWHTVLSSVSGSTVTQKSRVPAVGDSIVPITSFGDAGGMGQGSVVVVKNGDVHVSGQMDGRLSIVAEQTQSGEASRVSSSAFSKNTNGNPFDCYGANGNHNNGNIIIEGNTTYKNIPTDANDGRNVLGLIADNSIMVKAQPAGSDTYIDGELFARQGKFFAQNYGGSAMGTLSVYGSIAQNIRGPIGTVAGKGYTKYYKYDPRLQRTATSPPFSPSTGSYNIISWRE